MSNTGLVEKLQNLLDKYARNLNQVSQEDQKGRYKAAFDKIKREIAGVAYDVAISRMAEPFMFPSNTPEDVTGKFHDIVIDKMYQHRHFLWKERDAAAFCKACEDEWDNLLVFVQEQGGIFRPFRYYDNLSKEDYDNLMALQNKLEKEEV